MSGYFLPVKNLLPFCLKINDISRYPVANIGRKPFYQVTTEDVTANRFLDAMSRNAKEDAKVYLSKSFANRADLDKIQHCLCRSKEYKWLIKAEFTSAPKNCKTKSILVINEECRNSILHLHLVKEPDMFGNWKIYGIEQE